MIEWLRSRLVPEAGEWWRLSEIQLAGAFAAIGGSIAAHPDILLSLTAFLPSEGPWRVLVIGAVVLVLFIVPTLARLWDQAAPQEEADNGE